MTGGAPHDDERTIMTDKICPAIRLSGRRARWVLRLWPAHQGEAARIGPCGPATRDIGIWPDPWNRPTPEYGIPAAEAVDKITDPAVMVCLEPTWRWTN